MWSAALSSLSHVIAPTRVTCDEVVAHTVPACCPSHGGGAHSSVDMADLLAQAYGPDTGCPVRNLTVSCHALNDGYADATCCSQTHADVPGWFYDHLPAPEACLKDVKLPEGTVIRRLPEAVSKSFATRTHFTSTMLHSETGTFMMTPNVYVVHPKDMYVSCEKFGTVYAEDDKVMTDGECAWGFDRKDSPYNANEFVLTDLSTYAQRTLFLNNILTANCAKTDCCEADNVLQCIALKSPYTNVLPMVDGRVYKEHLYVSASWARYNAFGPTYADMKEGDSSMYDPDLFPWAEQESYLYRIRVADILNAKDGDRLDPEHPGARPRPGHGRVGRAAHVHCGRRPLLLHPRGPSLHTTHDVQPEDPDGRAFARDSRTTRHHLHGSSRKTLCQHVATGHLPIKL